MASERRPDSRRSERRYKGQTRAQAVEIRAQYVLELWIARPSLRYAGMKQEVIDRFECGIGSAEQAIARAYEIMAENRKEFAASERLFSSYMHIHEEQLRAKEHDGARRTLDSVRAHLGIGAPDRLELSGEVATSANYDLSDLSDAELDDIIAKVSKAKPAAKPG